MALDFGMFKWVVILALGGGIIGTIVGPNDPRYPDYIVNPKVICNREGFFPHPRNCSWFYRCVDRLKTGIYRAHYFECDPGTVFSDELDVCIFPSLHNNSCKITGQLSTTTTTVVVGANTQYLITPVNTVGLPPITTTGPVASLTVITGLPTTILAPDIYTVVPGQFTTVYPESVTPTTPPEIPTFTTTTVIVGTDTQYLITPVNTVGLPPITTTGPVASLTVITGLPTTIIDPDIYTVVPGQFTTVYPESVTPTTPPEIPTFTTTTVIVGTDTQYFITPVNTVGLPPITVPAPVASLTAITGLPTTIIVSDIYTVVSGQITTYVPQIPLTTVIVGSSTLITSISVNTEALEPTTITTNVKSSVAVPGSFSTVIVGTNTKFVSGRVTVYIPEIPPTTTPGTVTPSPTLPPITTTAPPVTPGPISTTTSAISSTPDAGLEYTCKFSKDACRIYDLCYPTKETKILCRGCYVQNYFIPNTDCPKGYLIDRQTKSCVEEPTLSSLCSSQRIVGTEGLFTLRCNALKSRPENEWIINQFCNQYAICDRNGVLLEIKNLCNNFYQCYRTPGGGWRPELRNCIAENLYSFEEDKCVAKPKDEDLCFWH